MANASYLPFETSLQELDEKINQLDEIARTHKVDMLEEIERMRIKRENKLVELYANLSPWDRIQVARHIHRPQTRDYIEMIFDEFLELHGDRSFGDDQAIVSGFGVVAGHKVMLIGQHKGRDVHERAQCNFGSPQPEGYRKALWKMQLAEKYKIPILCLIDTKGAAPDIGAEERGQSQAIAYNLMIMSGLKTPILCIVIGEGGSGGALGIGIGDRLLIQNYAYFSVISPEGCASILWKDPSKKEEAAAALKITAPELKALGVVDNIIEEPLGGAHRNQKAAAELLKKAIGKNLTELKKQPMSLLLDRRYARLRSMGNLKESQTKSMSKMASG